MPIFRGSPGELTPFWNSGRNDGTDCTKCGHSFSEYSFCFLHLLLSPKLDSVLSLHLASNQKTNPATREANVASKLCFCENSTVASFLKHWNCEDERKASPVL